MKINSCRLLSVGPFEVLTDELWMVRDLVSRIHIVSGKTSEGPISYVLNKDYDKFMDVQKNIGLIF